MAISLLSNEYVSAGLGAGFTASLAMDNVLNQSENTWQIVNAKTGKSAITISSFLSCDIRDESAIVDGPVEEGAFASYNKVQKPLEAKVSIAIMGDDGLLSDSLRNIKSLAESTELLNIVTPTAEYRDLNLENYNYTHKTENGRGILYVDLALKEIKQVKAQTSNEKIPTQKKKGKVQAKEEVRSIADMGLEGVSKSINQFIGSGR